jgi:hypothetical protein
MYFELSAGKQFLLNGVITSRPLAAVRPPPKTTCTTKAFGPRARFASRALVFLVLPIAIPICGLTETRYVNINSLAPLSPYTSWSTAATNIQDAIDIADPSDTVLVTNGVYWTGGRSFFALMTNRVLVSKPVRVESVNGPTATIIQGYSPPVTIGSAGAIRCVYLANGAVLSGFTITNGGTRGISEGYAGSGGGVSCESAAAVVTNCLITGNSAYWSGGGVAGGTLYNCILSGNFTTGSGGGSSD